MSESSIKRIAVIGAGASGMVAAICASKNNTSVTLFEHQNEPGRKILATGNGRCNMSNKDLCIQRYYSDSDDSAFIASFLERFNYDTLVSFFEALGLWVTEKGMLLYPETLRAATVRDILLNKIKQTRTNLVLNSNITSISYAADKQIFTVIDRSKSYEFDRVIMACGSYASISKDNRISSDIDGYSLAYHLGHTVLPVKPALCSLKLSDKSVCSLAGLRIHGKISVTLKEKTYSSKGELQFTDYGISGIPVFDVSRIIGRISDKSAACVKIVFDTFADNKEKLLKRIEEFEGKTIDEFFLGILPGNLCSFMMNRLEIESGSIIDTSIKEILKQQNELSFALTCECNAVAKAFENAQVCSGGVSLSELDRNFQSKIIPGLYIVGEMTDVDGICGGYNLHYAFGSGFIAGSSV